MFLHVLTLGPNRTPEVYVSMEVWAVTLDASAVGELEEVSKLLCTETGRNLNRGRQLYQKGLLVVDEASKTQLKKYYHRIDSVRKSPGASPTSVSGQPLKLTYRWLDWALPPSAAPQGAQHSCGFCAIFQDTRQQTLYSERNKHLFVFAPFSRCSTT